MIRPTGVRSKNSMGQFSIRLSIIMWSFTAALRHQIFGVESTSIEKRAGRKFWWRWENCFYPSFYDISKQRARKRSKIRNQQHLTTNKRKRQMTISTTVVDSSQLEMVETVVETRKAERLGNELIGRPQVELEVENDWLMREFHTVSRQGKNCARVNCGTPKVQMTTLKTWRLNVG